MTEREALIALNLIPDIGSVRLRRLLEAFGSAPKIFLNSASTLKKVEGIGEKIARGIASFPFEDLKKELDLSKKFKAKIITVNDEEYPENLKNIYDPPLCLYVKGELFPLDKLALALVGSRRASYYGLSCAKEFSYSLASLGITIVSGLARGIDTKAHEGALKAKARTLAVLGSGLNCMYPAENKELAEKIAKSGAVISEFPFNTAPLSRNFPRRNRVISGLSLGVVVIEAARNSGALITSDFALEQGRSVFALPGSVNSATSFGTNRLIKQGAKLIDSVEDIIEELRPEFSELRRGLKREEVKPDKEITRSSRKVPTRPQEESELNLAEDEKIVYNSLSEKPRYLDEIIEELSLSGPRIMSALLKLEMQGLVKQSPGKLFVKTEK